MDNLDILRWSTLIVVIFFCSYNQWVHINVQEILKETDKAFLVKLDDEYDEETIWLPFSQIADADQYAVGDHDVTLSITEFIAREKGIIE